MATDEHRHEELDLDPFLVALNELAGSAPGLAEATNLEELRNE
jgi:hypothetical protein